MIHHENSRGMIFFHQLGNVANVGFERDLDRALVVKDGGQVRAGHLVAQGFHVLDELDRAVGPFAFDTLQRIVQLAGRAKGALHLVQGLIQAFGDV